MKLVNSFLSRGVGRRIRRRNNNNNNNRANVAKNILRSRCTMTNNTNGTAKVTIDMSYIPSAQIQRIKLSNLFTDDEFQRLSAYYAYYKIDIVNAMFFSNNADGQVFIHYISPNDNYVSLENDFSRVVSYPMMKVKNVLFTNIKTKVNTPDGVFVFQGWNSTQILPDSIGDLVIYNRRQLSVDVRVRIVVRFRGYKGTNDVEVAKIPILKENNVFCDDFAQTDKIEINEIEILNKKEEKESQSNLDKEKLEKIIIDNEDDEDKEMYKKVSNLKEVFKNYHLVDGFFFKDLDELYADKNINKYYDLIDYKNKKIDAIYKNNNDKKKFEEELKKFNSKIWCLLLDDITQAHKKLNEAAVKAENNPSEYEKRIEVIERWKLRIKEIDSPGA